MNKSYVRSKDELAKISRSGDILGKALKAAEARAKLGTNLVQLDHFIAKEIARLGGKPSFKGFKGYPAASCLSVNQAIVHGLPKDYQLSSGDVLGIDIGVEYRGWFSDGATTVAIGTVDERNQELIAAAKEALIKAIGLVRPGIKVGKISAAIETVAKQHKLGIIKALSGHGIGRAVHEPPQIPNWGKAYQGPILKQGEVLAIEPMFSTGSGEVKLASDRWTVECVDGMGSHEEATVLVTKTGAKVLTPLFP